MSKKTRFRLLMIISVLVAFLIITLFFSAPSYFKNSIYDSGITVYANSGSVSDIQNAVNQANVAGGGTVIVPSGNWTFNMVSLNPLGGFCNRLTVGVVVPGGVNVIGMGASQTILFCPLNGWASGAPSSSAVGTMMFILDGRNDKPTRISGITFQGSVYMVPGANDNDHGLTGIMAYGAKDGRIDHCNFIDFTGSAISVSNNYVHNADGNCGVIDHCTIDNPYKNVFLEITGNKPLWAYGVIVSGDYGGAQWDPDWKNWFGQYHHDIWFIEDCSLYRCRHMVAGGSQSYGYYVLRNCHLEDMIVAGYGSYQDVHGGAEGCEVYNNVLQNTPVDGRSLPQSYWGEYTGIGLYSRGGFALYYGNEIRNMGTAIALVNDQSSNDDYRLNGVWVWSNSYVSCGRAFSTTPNVFPIRENVEYFLRSPSQEQDGFTYVSYTYPHPLTLGDFPVISTPIPTILTPTPTPSASDVGGESGIPTPTPSFSTEPTPSGSSSIPSDDSEPTLFEVIAKALDDFLFFIRWRLFGWWV